MLYQEKMLDILSKEELEELKKELETRYIELGNRHKTMCDAIDGLNDNEPGLIKGRSSKHIRGALRELYGGLSDIDDEMIHYMSNLMKIDEILESKYGVSICK